MKFPISIVLDRVRSVYNVGSVLRTSECAGIDEVITIGYSPKSSHPRVAKTSLGAEILVNSRHFETLDECIEKLFIEKKQIFAIEKSDNSTSLWEANIPHEPTALIFGHELEGVNTNLTDKYNISQLHIPQYGQKESLNIANACSIVIYDIVKRWNFGNH